MLSRFIPARTAFFLCDIQDRFRPLIYQFNDVVSTANKMACAAKIMNIPLVVTEQYPERLGNTVSDIDIKHAAMTIPKTRFSMVVPPVQELLEKNSISNVVLFGIESHVCVTQTALDLLETDDMNVYVLADGVSSMNEAEIPVALKRLSTAGAIISSSETVLFSLLKDSQHPVFKQTSDLVKQFSESTKNNELFKFVSSKL